MNLAQGRSALRAALDAAIARVNGRDAVRTALQSDAGGTASHVFAIGKAAASMMLGARDVLGDAMRSALVITKHGHLEAALEGDPRVRCLEASHPVPDESSLAAGAALLEFIEQAPSDARFLALVSGGASALVDVLPQGFGAHDLARFNEWLLGGGFDIHAMNRLRKRASRIKGGRLVTSLRGRPARALLISDVPGDDPKSVGSGLLVPHVEADLDAACFDLPPEIEPMLASPAALLPAEAYAAVRIDVVASAADARTAAVASLGAAGLPVVEHAELLLGDAIEQGAALVAAAVGGAPGAQVWSGETTVVLPPQPGRGGRCQALALAAAAAMQGRHDVLLLAAGTDGTDGPGEDAGAIVDGGTIERVAAAGLDASGALRAADAGTCLAASGDLVKTGPTGTNVMDLMIGLKTRT